ncbi:MAG: ABC transporter ATP-binding protein [Acidobacteria bacterium]|nr:ABC transporter ATP-binding protein [Acidobacteriota bacterium]
MHAERQQTESDKPLLEAVGLSRRYRRGGWLSGRRAQVEALQEVDLKIRAGSIVALLGASGSGKSTLARCLACLEEPDSGEIWFREKNLRGLKKRELDPCRRQIQLIFQEASGSLNPRFTSVALVSEPLVIAGVGTSGERRDLALERMELVGLPASLERLLPSELSGGQRRRLVIARALMAEPKVLILDEALSGLDLSTRAQVSNLLVKLQEVFSLTYLLISHDPALVAHLADDVAVIEKGRIVARGGRELAGNFSPSSGSSPHTHGLARVAAV